MINLKLRHKRKVIKEIRVSLQDFIQMAKPSSEKVNDLKLGYKAQGSIQMQGYKITYVATSL